MEKKQLHSFKLKLKNSLPKTAKIGFAETFDSTVYQTIDLCSSFSERKLKAICYSKIINTEEQKRMITLQHRRARNA